MLMKERFIFDFYWSPEGKRVESYEAPSLRKAKARFRRDYRFSYARYMGEIYVRVFRLDGSEVAPEGKG